MAKKSQSKPMKEILTRLEEFEYIKIVVFPEEVILKVNQIYTTKKRGYENSTYASVFIGTCGKLACSRLLDKFPQ